MIKIVLIIKEDCPACSIVKKVITQVINKIDCEITLKIINSSNVNINSYKVKVFPTTIFYKNVGTDVSECYLFEEITRLEGSFPIDYLNKVIDKLKLECND